MREIRFDKGGFSKINARKLLIFQHNYLIIRKLFVCLCQETRPERPRIFESFECKKSGSPSFILEDRGGPETERQRAGNVSLSRVYGPNCMKSAPYAAKIMKSSNIANERVVFLVTSTAVNSWDVYKSIEWCGEALAKKIRRGIIPDSEILENSSTVKSIAREAARLCRSWGDDVPARLESATCKEIRKRIASKILEYANAAA